MTTAEIKSIMEELSWDYDMVAIRTQEFPFELGTIDHCSHVWVDGDDTGVELDGICGSMIDYVDTNLNDYFGEHVAIIAGNNFSYGEDPGEVIIRDAACVRIIK